MENILHISDIHFGWDGKDPSAVANRKLCLDSMIMQISKLGSDWQPTIICLTGDIGWSGIESDYIEAKKWIDVLLKTCNLTYYKLVLCVGNHDVYRPDAEKIPRPHSSSEADKVLEVPIPEHYEKLTEQFTLFCQSSGIPVFQFGEFKSYLVGERIVNGLRFISLNSSWFARDKYDQGKLWIGLPHIKYMESKGQLSLIKSESDKPVTVVLMHHPKDWLHRDESHALSNRKCTLDYIAKRCNLLLTGHTHGYSRRSDRLCDIALNFTTGAVYAGDSYFNSFRLIKVQPPTIIYRDFEFDPRSADNTWIARPADSHPIFPVIQTTEHEALPIPKTSISLLREALKNHAIEFRRLKSRLLRQTGPLPEVVNQPVSVRVSEQTAIYSENGHLIRNNTSEIVMPFYDAVCEGRQILLLGDLGSGKSTLAAQLVVDTLARSENAVAILIPVKKIIVPNVLTQKALLEILNNFIANEILAEEKSDDLEVMLRQNIEILLMFDGLDEIECQSATRLLKEAASLVNHWPKIQVVASARPIELEGVPYSDWRIVYTSPLDDGMKKEFIRQELVADGVSVSECNEKANILVQKLKEMVSLNSIANTPLVIRLIYPRLIKMSSDSQLSLGDLLYDLLLERIDKWRKLDDKPNTFSHFIDVFKTAESKSEYLSVLADKVATQKQVTYDEAKTVFKEYSKNIPNANPELLSEEALSFYKWIGLISITNKIEFPLQPIAEICAAVGLFAQWQSNTSKIRLPDHSSWRIISFVATIVRRRGLLESMRCHLIEFINKLLAQPRFIPAACYIAVESGDSEIAKQIIAKTEKLGYRPLVVYQDERNVSTRNIAKTLFLAGDIGFQWFYNEYLNPVYPFPHFGSMVVAEIFNEWAALVQSTLSKDQREKLSKMVIPYAATKEGNFFGVLSTLSIIVPEAFLSPEDRYWYQSLSLDKPLFAEVVKKQFNGIMDKKETKEVLQSILFHRLSESVQAVKLWLAWNKDVVPPLSALFLAMGVSSKTEPSSDEIEIIKECRKRLGDSKWLRFARWAITTEKAEVSCGAAKILYDAGERRLTILGDALLKATHDGGYIESAEALLTVLVQTQKQKSIYWLANQIATADSHYGAFSAWWRILLKNIDDIQDGPALLVKCASNIGPYVLPRYPEVREAFSRILNGANGNQYRSFLRAALKSLNPNTRMGSALILLSNDPQCESEALFIAIRSHSKTNTFHEDELEDFILTMNFSPSVLLYLENNLNKIEPTARAFGIILLQKGNIKIDPVCNKDFLRSMYDWKNWRLHKTPACRAILESEEIFEILIRDLMQGKPPFTARAAELLLELFDNKLNALQKARCLLMRNGSTHGSWGLPEIISRLKREPAFAQELIDASANLEIKSGRPSLPLLAAKANLDNQGWKDIVWNLLCNDSGGAGLSESDDGGMVLLEVGLENKEYGMLIGQAAKEFLNDPRVLKNHRADSFHWLALLAHEFADLNINELKGLILHGRPISYSATTALIARLGEVPSGFSVDRHYIKGPPNHIEKNGSERNLANVIQSLKDYSRDSQSIHPQLHVLLQECIYLPILDDAVLQNISSSGNPGIMIATTLRYIYGLQPNMSETIPLLDTWSHIWTERQEDPGLNHLIRIWQSLRNSAIYDNIEEKNRYLKGLDQALLQNEVWKMSIVWDILQVRGSLLNEQIPIVFSEYARNRTFLHEIILHFICEWLQQDLSKETISILIKASEEVIVSLNEAPFYQTESELSNTCANLLFPVIVWAFTHKESEEAEAVFLRGLRSVFENITTKHGEYRNNLVKLFAQLDPFFAKIPGVILTNLVKNGVDSCEPSVSVFCKLIAAFGENLSN